jgi:hypothetical protein
MDLFKICLQILRRDPGVTRDDILFVTIFGSAFLVIISLTVVTLVFGDGATFVRWLLGK